MKSGFTLIEMLSVVIILAILFLVVTPKLVSLIENGENKNKELVEEKLLDASKEYVNNYNTSFLKDLINVGDTKNIILQELVNAGLIEESDYSTVDNLEGVRVELLGSNKLNYVIVYDE